MLASKPFVLSWLGPIDEEFDWLIGRVRQECVRGQREFQLHHFAPDQQLAFEAKLGQSDRVIVSHDCRIEYPLTSVAYLQSQVAIVPWAVVTGSYLSGARRTGLGPPSHPQLPWYRWWEGWRGWFFPELVRPAALSRAHFDSLPSPGDWVLPRFDNSIGPAAREPIQTVRCASQPRVAIVASCMETQRVWCEMALHVGWQSATYRTVAQILEDLRASGTGNIALDCLMLDDSALVDSRGRWTRDFEHVASWLQTKSIPTIAGLELVHLGLWSSLRARGIEDFLVKPSFGLPLCEYLWTLHNCQPA